MILFLSGALFALRVSDAGVQVLAGTEPEVVGFGPGVCLALNMHSKPFVPHRLQGVDLEHLICGGTERYCAGRVMKPGQRSIR